MTAAISRASPGSETEARRAGRPDPRPPIPALPTPRRPGISPRDSPCVTARAPPQWTDRVVSETSWDVRVLEVFGAVPRPQRRRILDLPTIWADRCCDAELVMRSHGEEDMNTPADNDVSSAHQHGGHIRSAAGSRCGCGNCRRRSGGLQLLANGARAVRGSSRAGSNNYR